MNRISAIQSVRVIASLVEGNSIRATVRMTGVAKNTIVKLLDEISIRATFIKIASLAICSASESNAMRFGLSATPKKRTFPKTKRDCLDSATFGLGRPYAPIEAHGELEDWHSRPVNSPLSND